MAKLALARANRIVNASLAKAKELDLKPLVVAVLDEGGNMKAYAAQDGTTPGRFEVASGKARGALLIGGSTRSLNAQATERPHFLAAIGSAIPGGIIPVPGGVAILDARGNILGAVGISGDTSDNDEACAIAGIQAAGLVNAG